MTLDFRINLTLAAIGGAIYTGIALYGVWDRLFRPDTISGAPRIFG